MNSPLTPIKRLTIAAVRLNPTARMLFTGLGADTRYTPMLILREAVESPHHVAREPFLGAKAFHHARRHQNLIKHPGPLLQHPTLTRIDGTFFANEVAHTQR